jgi:diacylglycerol kinase (ATP)
MRSASPGARSGPGYIRVRSAVIPFIVNTRARRASGWRQAARALSGLGVEVAPWLVDEPRQLAPSVERAIASGARTILLGGGDGSISQSIGPLLGTDVVTGFIPLGTGNGIARSLGIGSIEEACRAVAAGRRVRTSVGRANGAYFLNMASVGLSVEVSRGLSRRLKHWVGYGAYPTSIARALARVRPLDLTSATAAGHTRLQAIQVFVLNGTYAARWPHIGLIRPAGNLTVCVLEPDRLLRLGLAALRLWSGVPLEELLFSCNTLTQATFVVEPEAPVNVDGEIIERTPLEVGILPDALLVYAA